MIINPFEVHDRYEDFTRKGQSISECCQKIINEAPFGDVPFYIFAHKRTIEMDERLDLIRSGRYKRPEDVPSARILWQPRLTKPKAQENSMLFKVYPGKDTLKVIWMLPDRVLWGQYTKGKMTENSAVSESIHDFLNNKERLEAPEEDDLPESRVDAIYKELSRGAQKRRKINSI